jgi:hypothetical protein
MDVIKATSAADFRGLVPALIGYTPTRSIVAIPFAGSRTVGAARFDLNPTLGSGSLASSIVGVICRVPTADRMAVVIYTDDDSEASRGLVNALLARADECGLSVTDALYVARDGWGSYLSDDHPRPLAEINTALAVGHPVAASQHAGTEIPAADDTRLCEVNTAFEGFGLGDVAETDWITLGEVAVTTPAEEIDPFEAACLIFALSRPALRDVALVQWASDQAGGERAAEAQAGWERGEEYPADLAAIMWGDAPRPDAARLSAALTTVRHLTALTPQPVRAGLLASAAWLSWALGRSTHAADYARQALAIDPSHGLAEIVASFIQASHLPSWAFEN